jgi:hypothetical protein
LVNKLKRGSDITLFIWGFCRGKVQPPAAKENMLKYFKGKSDDRLYFG